MRGRIALFVLLGSSLAFLASLFLPWRDTTTPSFVFVTSATPFNLGQGGQVDGWVGGPGDVAVLLVVALALATIAALRRPELAAKLPFGRLALALGYFTAAAAIQVRALSLIAGGFTGHPRPPHASWAYGFYIGLAGAATAGVCGLILRRSELRPPQGTDDAVAGPPRHRSALLVSPAMARVRGAESQLPRHRKCRRRD